MFSATADDPFDDFFGGGRRNQRSRGRMGGSLFGSGGFPPFAGFSGFDSGRYTPMKKNHHILRQNGNEEQK